MEKNYKANRTKLELLAPAGSLDIGLEAISAGADAVYIGAPKFGARAAAGVSLANIATLVNRAHLYGVKVYVALNTILYDSELNQAESLAKALYLIGVDALIIQDFSLLSLDLPPIPLHASTQCHNNDAETLYRLEKLGFEQAVLARELNVEQTRNIANSLSTLKLETFIHGALCVCYSGQCYLSQAFKGRSANRGDCAQLCRLPYSLYDSEGKHIRENQYLLSLKDLNRSHILPELIRAGVTSFKIEGRLKSASYVKNVTAYYRNLLDSFIAEHAEHYKRASLGNHEFKFTPNPFKSFSRGATNYQLFDGNRVKEPLIRPNSPKSEGELLAVVKQVKGSVITLTKPCDLHNGDGVCFYQNNGTVQGGRINRVINSNMFHFFGEQIPQKGTLLYRNYDSAFEEIIQRNDATSRSIPILMLLEAFKHRLDLTMWSEVTNTIYCKVSLPCNLDSQKQPLNNKKLIEALSKLGNTPFTATDVQVLNNGWFVPSSLITELRRKATVALIRVLKIKHLAHTLYRPTIESLKYKITFPTTLSYQSNVSNKVALSVYQKLGVNNITPAFELEQTGNEALMTTKHCLRRFLGYCTLENKQFPYKEPLFLSSGSLKIQLKFDCKRCQMLLFRKK